MREIKFRLWHPEYMDDGVLIPAEMNYNPRYMKVMVTPRTQLGDDNTDSVRQMAVVDINLNFAEAKDIMQYTGFKDWKLKEIYEDDVILISCFKCSGKLQPAIVGFNNGGFMYTGTDCEDHGGWMNAATAPECEVIGNVYENPELIEKHD